jgi:hypothetical protein
MYLVQPSSGALIFGGNWCALGVTAVECNVVNNLKNDLILDLNIVAWWAVNKEHLVNALKTWTISDIWDVG